MIRTLFTVPARSSHSPCPRARPPWSVAPPSRAARTPTWWRSATARRVLRCTLIAPRVALTAAHCITAAHGAGAPPCPRGIREHPRESHGTASGSCPRRERRRRPPGVQRAVDALRRRARHPRPWITNVTALRMADRSPAADDRQRRRLGRDGRARLGGARSPAPGGADARSDARVQGGSATSAAYDAPSMLCASGAGETPAPATAVALVATLAGHPVLVGITSFGYGCARIGHPAFTPACPPSALGALPGGRARRRVSRPRRVARGRVTPVRLGARRALDAVAGKPQPPSVPAPMRPRAATARLLPIHTEVAS